jgi:hypothetical protein
LLSPARFQRYDRLITSTANTHRLDPMLVKAIVWRESRFDPQKYGTAGERGLMQVTEKAANEWARENKMENFRGEELFDPKTNLAAGSRVQRRSESGAALGRRRRRHAIDAGISRQHRFSRDAQLYRIGHLTLRVL